MINQQKTLDGLLLQDKMFIQLIAEIQCPLRTAQYLQT